VPQPEWDALVEEVRDLRTRVARMEMAMGMSAHAEPAAAMGSHAPGPDAAEPAPPAPPLPGILDAPTSLLPVLGRALLGLAGAFLLRALTEAGTFSPRMGVAIGLVYAMMWLVWAARTPAARRLETALHGLTAVLDWEFAAWSDRLEDLGWFCARCWRFGQFEKEAGGIGSRAALLRGYERVSGMLPAADAIFFWEVYAHVRWSIIAIQQGERHVSGEEPSLELALTAHIVPELELEILRMTGVQHA